MGCGGSKINMNYVDKSHFEIQRTIGHGGFGCVNAVQKLTIDGTATKHKREENMEWLAMKELKKSNIVNDKALGRLLLEMQLLAQLNHEFIVNLRWAFTDSKCCYMVMDLANGGDLRFHLNRAQFELPGEGGKMFIVKGRFPPTRSKYYSAALTLALEHCHANGIIHRDM